MQNREQFTCGGSSCSKDGNNMAKAVYACVKDVAFHSIRLKKKHKSENTVPVEVGFFACPTHHGASYNMENNVFF